MTAPKTLNLDALAAVKLSVTLHGKEHPVKELSVEDFIQAQASAKELEGLTEETIVGNIEASIKHLHKVLPSIEADELRKLSMAQLLVLIQFVNGTLQDEADKGAEVVEQAKGTDAKN